MNKRILECEKIIKHKNYKNMELHQIINFIRKINWSSEEDVEIILNEIIEEMDKKIKNNDHIVLKKIANILKTKHVPKDIWSDIWFLKSKDFRNFKSVLMYLIQFEKKVTQEKIIYYSKNVKNASWMTIHEIWRSYMYNLMPLTKYKKIKKYDEVIIFDIEFDMQNGREQIIELSAIKVKNNRVVGTFDKLIKNNFRLSKKFKDITNIKEYDLKYKNSDTIIIKEFFKFIENSNILVGFAIEHNDIPMLKRFDIVKKMNMFDLRKYSILDLQSYLSESKNEQRSLNYYLSRVNIDEESITLHRALEDVSVMYELYLSLDYREIIIPKMEL